VGRMTNIARSATWRLQTATRKTTSSLVLGDRIQPQQVILDLIVNANEALSAVIDGPRELLISSIKEASNDVLVTVSDTGPRFDGAKRENIFDAIYATKPEGMAIGLAVSRSIIEAMAASCGPRRTSRAGRCFNSSCLVAGRNHDDPNGGGRPCATSGQYNSPGNVGSGAASARPRMRRRRSQAGRDFK